jgi:toxin FitB
VIILDSDVISGMMTDRPNARLSFWFSQHVPSDLHATAVSIFEIRFGIERVVKPTIAAHLTHALNSVLLNLVSPNVMPLDAAASEIAARLHAHLGHAKAHTIVPDTLIASIAKVHGATIATRNTQDFIRFGVPLVDPWQTLTP